MRLFRITVAGSSDTHASSCPVGLQRQNSLRVLCSSSGLLVIYSFCGCCFHSDIGWYSLRKPKNAGVRHRDPPNAGEWWRVRCDWSRCPLRIRCCSRAWVFVSNRCQEAFLCWLVNPICQGNFELHWTDGCSRFFRPHCGVCQGPFETLKLWTATGAIIIRFTVKGQDRTFSYTFSKFFSVSHTHLCCLLPRD